MAITQAMCTSFKVELLKGTHNFSANNNTVTMSEGQVWFVNSAYHHSVYNNNDKTRIAILGKMEVNEHNTGLLRTRT